MNFPLQVHSGDKLSEVNFIEIWNEDEYGSVYRPQGGYWLSEYTPNDEFPSIWLKWIYANDEPMVVEFHSRPYYSIYQIKEEAKLYLINTYHDLLKLIIKYPLIEGRVTYIDFEKVAREWDGIYLTRKGFDSCEYPDKNVLLQYNVLEGNEPTLKGWEIPSLVVFNPEILGFIEQKENERYVEQ